MWWWWLTRAGLETCGQDEMAESGEDLLRGLRPLRAGEVEEGGREGEKKWVGAPFLHGQQVAQNIQEKNAHLCGVERKRERGGFSGRRD